MSWRCERRRLRRIAYAGAAPSAGTFVAPHIIVLDAPARLDREVFGPILHVVRWKAGALDGLLDAIAATGYGLTLGIHSRIDETVRRVVDRLPVGNVYVNRNIIGAVVGTQPFGGSGLSAPGRKPAGRTTSAVSRWSRWCRSTPRRAGGNASLIAMEDE